MTHQPRKLAALLAADIAGYSRLTAADEEGTVARLRALRAELIDPAIASHAGRIVKTAGDGMLIEFASVVDAVRAAVAVQTGMTARNARLDAGKRIEFRIGIHLGDVLVQPDGDLLGDGVNIAARLEGIAEPGGICLSRAAHEQVEGKVEAAFADLGEQSLKNIARPVRVYSVTSVFSPSPPRGGGEGRDEVGDARAPASTSPSRAVGAGPSLSATRRGEDSPPRLSIVVLPFANLGGDPEQEYFVDGVTESLTTDLSRISGSFVIARNTAFTYKGKPVDVKQVGRELNIRYALEGSVQKGGNRLRVNVQLIEAETGAHLWAERFDKPVADLFDMQDEIVTRLVRTLNVELITAEARRARQKIDPDALDMAYRGWAAVHGSINLENTKTALAFFSHALLLDLANVEALTGVAWVHGMTVGGFLTEDRATALRLGKEAAAAAIKLAPRNPFAHMSLGWLHAYSGQEDRAIAEFEYALMLDPNQVFAQVGIGTAKVYDGRAADTEAHVEQALQLSPRDTARALWTYIVGYSKMMLGRDDEAVAWLQRAIEGDSKFAMSHFFLAGALARLGRMPEAKDAVQAGLLRDPHFTMHRFRNSAMSGNVTYMAQRERLCDGMRTAGVPEG